MSGRLKDRLSMGGFGRERSQTAGQITLICLKRREKASILVEKTSRVH